MIGSGDNLFRPQDNISRVEVATATNRALGRIDSWEAKEAANVNNLHLAREFPDLSTVAWYFPAVLFATNDHFIPRVIGGAIDWETFDWTQFDWSIFDGAEIESTILPAHILRNLQSR
jgi:hypothetical protein